MRQADKYRDQLLQNAIADMEAASSILCGASKKASNLGIALLKGSHEYLYAAMLADVVRDVKRDDWIGPAVRMKDSTIKPTGQFFMDHLFGTVFRPLFERGGTEFLSAVRAKADAIIEARA